VQASLTGHLVLSTLHTNTAIGAITRLQDMGIEPFLLSSSLVAVLSQRLVRLLCTQCREACEADEQEKALLGVPASDTQILYRPVGCAACRNSGFQGRAGLFECIRVDAPLRQLIHAGAGEERLLEQARTQAGSLQQDGMRLVREGLSSLAEVLRVTSSRES
jgi:general secretion pathway protein E